MTVTAGAAHIRRMVAGDLSDARAIDRDVSIVAWPESGFLHALDYGYHSWVALLNESLVGFCIGRQVLDEFSILNIAVSRSAQSRGLGRQLMEHALSGARSNGAVDAFLEVRQSNRVAHHLYNSLGFNTVGIRENYYPAADSGEWENAVLMACALISGDTEQENE